MKRIKSYFDNQFISIYFQQGQKNKAKEQYQAVIDMKAVLGVDLKEVKGKVLE